MFPAFPVLILHITGAVGFVVVITMGVIAQPVRDLWGMVFQDFPRWSKMIECPMCFGFWGGSGWSVLLLCRPIEPPWLALGHDCLAFAFTVSLIGFLVALVDHAVGGLGSIKTLPRHKPSLRRRGRW